MTKQLDKAGRRRRFSVQPHHDRQLAITKADLLRWQALRRHGPQTAPYLHAYTVAQHPDYANLRKRLNYFSHEPLATFGKGPVLFKPEQQKAALTLNLYANHLVYDLTDDGRALLDELGLLSQYPAAPGGPWLHQYMTACITASIELATLKRPNIRYLSADDLLPADVSIGTPLALRNPRTNSTSRHTLVPDGLFGLEYISEKKRRIFFVETDRATEPIYTADFRRRSWYRTYLQYLEFIGRRVYRSTYGITDAPAVVLIVTTSPTQKHNIINMLMKETSGKGCTFMLFQTAPEFNPFTKPPGIMSRFLEGPWERAGQPDFIICS